MSTLRSIKRKIGSIQSTQTITRTMQMVAAARLKKAQTDLLNNRPYSETMRNVMGHVVLKTDPQSHPFIAQRDVSNILLIVFTADRGLCGAFNLNVITKVEELTKEMHGVYDTISFYTIGKKGRDSLKKSGKEIVNEIVDTRSIEFELAKNIGREVLTYYQEMRFDKIALVYNRFLSVMRQEVMCEELVPIQPPETTEPPVEFLFEPSQDEMLDSLISAYVEVQVYKALLESQASEHSARMNAMDSATSNCDELIRDLTLLYNKTRQAGITKEMMDIVGGAEALM
ncbi:MAG: ATP synthase F1 subunit gamma [Thermodesulfobacteriota bacterium]|nr:ATP synthase F1 subunit gamma [Thermodesulfobacteriota bacterium]